MPQSRGDTSRTAITELLDLQRVHWPDAASLAHELTMLATRFVEVSQQRFAAAAQAHGLGLSGFDVLATLRRLPPPHEATPGRLQTVVLISSGGLTKVLDQLERGGFVTREVDGSDRRVRRVRLTREGREAVERVMAEALSRQEAILAELLSAREQAALARLLGTAIGS